MLLQQTRGKRLKARRNTSFPLHLPPFAFNYSVCIERRVYIYVASLLHCKMVILNVLSVRGGCLVRHTNLVLPSLCWR
jgi:hypothetical protein